MLCPSGYGSLKCGSAANQNVNGTINLRNSLADCKKLNIYLPHDWIHFKPLHYFKRHENICDAKNYTKMFITALHIMKKKKKQRNNRNGHQQGDE